MAKKTKIKRVKKRIKKRNKKEQINHALHGKLILLFYIGNVPIIFMLLVLYPLTVLSLIPEHPCFHHVGTEPVYTWNVPATAYSSTLDQTDSTPFITADQTFVHWGVIAANFLPFKTCVKFPERYGDQWFIVHDRKHERFSESIDIWHPSREEAKQFGLRILETHIWY